jgi:hypothetical protein
VTNRREMISLISSIEKTGQQVVENGGDWYWTYKFFAVLFNQAITALSINQ